MPLQTNSPRIDLRNGDLNDAEKYLSTIGHVVLDNVWNINYLEEIYLRSKQRYQNDDERFSGRFEDFASTTIDTYLGGHLDFNELKNEVVSDYSKDVEDQFFIEYQRAGLTPLMHLLFQGSFMVGKSERVVRRADPKFPVRFTGLHADGQLGACSQMGLRSKRELTLWTPLNSVQDDSRPRLLLLDKKETSFLDIFEAEELLEESNVKYLPIQLKPFQIKSEDDYWAINKKKITEYYSRIFKYKSCYAPYLPLGSAILFSKEIIHGSYILETMKESRYSFDVRHVGEFKINKHNSKYAGVVFPASHSLPRVHRQYAIIINIKIFVKKILIALHLLPLLNAIKKK